MSGMYGADVAQLRQLAGQFDRAADRLDQDRMTVGNAIQISAWAGPVAVRFRLQWSSEHTVRLSAASARLREAALALRRNADDQERTSAVDGGASGAGGRAGVPDGDTAFRPRVSLPPGIGWADLYGTYLKNVIIGSANGVATTVDVAGLVVDLVAGKSGGVAAQAFDVWKVVPGGSYASSALTGIGLGDAGSRLAGALRDRDWSGAMVAGADGVFGMAPSGVSLLWEGAKGMTEFFIPLDASSRSEHITWMESRGYSDLGERYSGFQGFVNLGNDNVERKAPWLNRAAEKVLQKPAEWLYNAGIKLY